MPPQTIKKRPVAGPHGGRPIQDHDIQPRKLGAMAPERFPDHSLQAVAANRKPAEFLGDSQAEPCFLLAVVFVENRKHIVATAFCLLKDATIRGSIGKPVSPPETASLDRACCRLFFRGNCDRDR